MTASEKAFIESMRLTRKEICDTFGIPITALGKNITREEQYMATKNEKPRQPLLPGANPKGTKIDQQTHKAVKCWEKVDEATDALNIEVKKLQEIMKEKDRNELHAKTSHGRGITIKAKKTQASEKLTFKLD